MEWTNQFTKLYEFSQDSACDLEYNELQYDTRLLTTKWSWFVLAITVLKGLD